MIPAAAVAAIQAEIEDAAIDELLHAPRNTAVRVAQQLEALGWDLVLRRAPSDAQTAA
jgi:hypothetical protein